MQLHKLCSLRRSFLHFQNRTCYTTLHRMFTGCQLNSISSFFHHVSSTSRFTLNHAHHGFSKKKSTVGIYVSVVRIFLQNKHLTWKLMVGNHLQLRLQPVGTPCQTIQRTALQWTIIVQMQALKSLNLFSQAHDKKNLKNYLTDSRSVA